MDISEQAFEDSIEATLVAGGYRHRESGTSTGSCAWTRG